MNRVPMLRNPRNGQSVRYGDPLQNFPPVGDNRKITSLYPPGGEGRYTLRVYESTGFIVNRKVTICNRAGLHARPISKFVETASRFASNLTVRYNGHKVDGKSIIQLMTLAAHFGAELELMSEGGDAEMLLDALEELIMSKFDEE